MRVSGAGILVTGHPIHCSMRGILIFVLDGKSEKGKFETSEGHGVFESDHDAVAATFA